MNSFHLHSVCRRLRWHRIVNPPPSLRLNPLLQGWLPVFINPFTSQVRGPLCTVQTPHWHLLSESYWVLQPDNHWFSLWPLALFAYSAHLVVMLKRIFSSFYTGGVFHITSCLLALCALMSSRASVRWMHGVLWQVHCPLWDGMHGWLIQPICQPQRG